MTACAVVGMKITPVQYLHRYWLSPTHTLLTGVDLVRPLHKSALRLLLPCGPRQGRRPGPAPMTASSPYLKWFSILVHWVEWCSTVPCLALASSFLLSNDKRESKGGFDLLPASGDVFPIIARVLAAVTQMRPTGLVLGRRLNHTLALVIGRGETSKGLGVLALEIVSI